MEQSAALIIWLASWLAVQAQDMPQPDRLRVKAAEACMYAVAHAPAPAEGDAIAPPWGGLPSGDAAADANWLIRRAAEGHVAGHGVVRVLHYDAALNRVIIWHEVPRLPADPVLLKADGSQGVF